MNRIFVLFFVLGGVLTNALPLVSSWKEYIEDSIDLSSLVSDLYGNPDQELTGALVANYGSNMDEDEVNPEELGTYLEGDMLVPRSAHLMRSGLPTLSHRWPQGIVPYEIIGNFTDEEIAIIQTAIDEYHNRTCIRFVPHVNEDDYVQIENDSTGCWSAVGRAGGRQSVNFQTPGCLRKIGTAIHELMHTLGFLHEQNREERDDYVVIKHENVRTTMIKNFRKVNQTMAFGVGYDYGSIMHYSRKAFSINGRSTLKPIKKLRKGVQLGQRIAFSERDLIKINRMYNCTPEEESVSPLPEDYSEEETEEDTREEMIEEKTETSDQNSLNNTFPEQPSHSSADVPNYDIQSGNQKVKGERLYYTLVRLYLKFKKFLT